MHPGLVGFVVLLSASALVGAVLLSRHDRAGTGFLLGAGLGPVGVVVILLRREYGSQPDHRRPIATIPPLR